MKRIRRKRIRSNRIGYKPTTRTAVSRDCNSGEVELWGVCYNIEETTELDLLSSGLTGEIPRSIGDLTNLTFLRLHNNQLTGEIPPEIGQLTNLIELDLSYNNLSGEIPLEIGNLINLTKLGLSQNELTGPIPPGIFLLPHIHHIVLRNNQLTGEIPKTIGKWGRGFGGLTLGALDLSSNQLSGTVPPDIGDIVTPCWMVTFNLSNNQLTWIHDSFCNVIAGCDALTIGMGLNLTNNNLCSWPDCIPYWAISGLWGDQGQDCVEYDPDIPGGGPCYDCSVFNGNPFVNHPAWNWPITAANCNYEWVAHGCQWTPRIDGTTPNPNGQCICNWEGETEHTGTECCPTGDLNLDSEVNVEDVIFLVDTIIEYDGPIPNTDPAYYEADMDAYDISGYPYGDGSIDILDIMNLVQMVLNDPQTTSADRRQLQKQLSRLSGLNGRL